MPTLLDLKTQAAGILGVSASDFTVDGQDLWLSFANQAKKTAEENHDFEFSRKLVTVSVSGTTGGSLEAAVDADDNSVDVKTVLDVGIVNDSGNLVPTVWTTVAENLERQRQFNPGGFPLWRRDGDENAGVIGQANFSFSGTDIFRWPRTDETDTTTYSLSLEVYAFSDPWTTSNLAPASATVTGTLSPDATGSYAFAGTFFDTNFFRKTGYSLYYDGDNDQWILSAGTGIGGGGSDIWNRVASSATPAGTYTAQGANTGTATVSVTNVDFSDIWTKHGSQYILWSTVVYLNKIFKTFVPRQEGNLPPPTDLAEAGLQAIIEWDSNLYEQHRRHNR